MQTTNLACKHNISQQRRKWFNSFILFFCGKTLLRL